MRSVLFALSLVACTSAPPAAVPPSREPESTPKVVVIPEMPDEPDPPSSSPPATASECDVRYHVERIDLSSPSCTVDIPAVGAEARLECKSGSANLHFENRDYKGSATSTGVELDLVSTYDFTDGCLWEATAHISGVASSPLRLDYTEHTIRGAGCSESCTATAQLGVIAP